MNNKKIIEFPVNKKGYTGIRNKTYRDFELNHGYSRIKFSSKELESDFKESMKLFTEFIENINDPKYAIYIEDAIALSKYNVDARVWKIVSKDCAEYEIELALLRLKEEVYTFEEGYVEGKLFPINYLHLIVCHHLAEFYLGNKLYSKVWDAYKPFYMALDMADEVLVPM